MFPALRRLRSCANDIGVRLAGCEMMTGVAAFESFLGAGVYDVVMPDVKYAGGLAEMLRIADAAANRGVLCSPHNPTGPIAHLASIHLCAASPTLLWLEHQWDESPLFDSLVGGVRAPLVDGALVVPVTPGLGATLDRELAAAHPWRPLPANANLDERLG